MIGIIDYGSGNVKSVENALKRIGISYFISSRPLELKKADKIIFPGVGNAEFAMKQLQKKKLDIFLRQCHQPVLGICLGMQLLFKFSEEGNTECLGIISGKVKKFDVAKCKKVPHIGWNKLKIKIWKFKVKNNLLKKISKDAFMYFVHSYYAPICEETIAVCDYGVPFSAIVQKNNFWGCQFHPEKSGKIGEQILRNFIKF